MAFEPMISRWTTLGREDREREYNPSSCLVDGDYRPYVAEYRRASDAVWARVGANPDASITVVEYGAAPSQTIDVVVPVGTAAPLLVFLHGGYWQELSKLDSRFPADRCVAQGWAFAAVDYTLAPAATLDEIVAECVQAVTVLRDRAAEFGVDAERIVVAGSSAGAHLAAMVARSLNASDATIAGAVLVSGVFELEPLIGLSINDALGLDEAGARRNSPALLGVEGFPPAVLAYGSNETDEFKAQSADFAQHLEAAGVETRLLEVVGRNHFDVVLDLVEPGTSLGHAVGELIQSLPLPEGH